MSRAFLKFLLSCVVWYLTLHHVQGASVRGVVEDGLNTQNHGPHRTGRDLQELGSITGFDLLNAITDTKYTTLTNGQVIVVSAIPGMTTPNFNIVATFSGTIQSVVFDHNGNAAVHKENAAPWAFCGNMDALYATCTLLGYGTHTVTATPYGSKDGLGTKGTSVSITFSIVSGATPAPLNVPVAPPVSPPNSPTVTANTIAAMELIYTGTPAPHLAIFNLILGATNKVDLKTLNVPSAQFSVNTIPASGASILSVAFNNGHNENGLPWAYCGNSGTTYNTCGNLVVGATVTIVVTPYPQSLSQGTPFPTVSTTIQIIDSRLPQPTMPTPTAPVPTPPVAPTTCSQPKLSGTNWQDGKSYPLKVAEAQGAMIGTTLVVSSGFDGTWSKTTPKTYGLDTSNPNADWNRLDDQPVALALTHSGFVAIGTKFYMCGGYKGGNEGPTTNTCLVLDITKPSGQQWSFLAPLPGIGHAGGGMVYDAKLNALIYAGGALRIHGKPTVDLDNTWMYSFNNIADGWVARAPIPYKANHISFVTAKDGNGVYRHFFAGGQEAEGEANKNVVHHYEYNAVQNVWTQRKSQEYPRGHASSSTRPVGCGYLMIGGTTNGWNRKSDVTYYDIPTDTWTKIGDLPWGLNTPVCDINRVTNMLYCESGSLDSNFSHKRQLIV